MITISYFWFVLLLIAVALITVIVCSIVLLGDDLEQSPLFGLIVWLLVPFVFLVEMLVWLWERLLSFGHLLNRCYKYIKKLNK